MNKPVIVKQDPAKPIPTEVIAENIKAIADGVRRIRQGRLNDKALVLLVYHATPSTRKYGQGKVGMAEVKAVLAGLESLEAEYLKPVKKK